MPLGRIAAEIDWTAAECRAMRSLVAVVENWDTDIEDDS